MKLLSDPLITSTIDWTNENQGIISVAIFMATITIGWASGIFSALRRKPKFKLELIPGPSFVCTFGIGKQHGEYDIHRTGVSIYLRVSNVGSAAASIKDIHVGYHWCVKPFSINWLKYRLGWFWLTDQTVVSEDFKVCIGNENTKLYPFLTQTSTITGTSAESYLEVGKTTNGVTYFEQTDSWGGCFPVAINHLVRIKIKVIDSFDRTHHKKFLVPKLNLEGARSYNPSFGLTLASINKENEQLDLNIDQHGNAFPVVRESKA